MASNKITKRDLDEMAVRSMAEQCCFSFERMQAVGFCYGMTKCFRKIHGDNNEEMAAAMQNNLDFINTEPHMAAILQGLIVSMEEAGQDRGLIHSLKTGLFGPLAGLGDAIWWYTACPSSHPSAAPWQARTAFWAPSSISCSGPSPQF